MAGTGAESLSASAARPRVRRSEIHFGDRVFSAVLRSAGGLLFLLLGAVIFLLIWRALPAFRHMGFDFLTSVEWNAVTERYGVLSFIYGTVVSSVLAVLIATPIAVGIALFLVELAPRWLLIPMGFLLEMLAAIPSVVYGLWGIFVLTPQLRETVQPFLAKSLGFLPLFQGAPYGIGMLTGALILSVMIIPSIAAISREVFRAIPLASREAALALGATRWESIRLAVLRASITGIFAAVVLGLGRAFGETMAVTMVIGNRAQISASLFAPAQTMASAIANEYTEATSDLHLSALAGVGAVLMLVSVVVNSLARLIVSRLRTRMGGTGGTA